MSAISKEQTRIATDLHKGCSGLLYDTLVRNKAGDVLQIINAFWAETARADQLQAKLNALQGSEESTDLAVEVAR